MTDLLRSAEAGIAAAEHALRSGVLLLEAKKQLNHGEWLPWLEEYTALDERTAQRWMQIAKLDPTPVSGLSLREALRLVPPPAERKARDPSVQAGKTLEESSSLLQKLSLPEDDDEFGDALAHLMGGNENARETIRRAVIEQAMASGWDGARFHDAAGVDP